MNQPEEKLLQLFRRHCRKSNIINAGDRLLVAVSGGLDSCVLLDLLQRLRDEWQLHLTVGHVHHGLRGEAADRDAEFVAELAAQHDLPFLTEKVEVGAFARQNRLSLETAGRKLRYRALDRMRQLCGAPALVLAHHRDDQAETVLAHMLRGSGWRGLAGMSPRRPLPKSEGEILRPLLAFSRDQILAYAQQRQLGWHEDHTNTEVQFQRNRIRHELLPLLRRRFNPGVEAQLLRLANISAQTEVYLEHATREALAEVTVTQEIGKIVLDLQRFWKYFRIIQAGMVRFTIRRLLNAEVTLTFGETARIVDLLLPPANQRMASRTRRYLWRNVVEVAIDQTGAAFRLVRPAPAEQILVSGQRRALAEAGVSIVVWQEQDPGDWRQRINLHSQFVDAAAIRGSLRVRFPRTGDRFKPLGMTGFKKLSDFFIDSKVPYHKRATIPLVECERGIVWVCGYRLDDRFKVTTATQSMLHLQLEPL
jgi:tRNA(Ile)-lysidine synthase